MMNKPCCAVCMGVVSTSVEPVNPIIFKQNEARAGKTVYLEDVESRHHEAEGTCVGCSEFSVRVVVPAAAAPDPLEFVLR